MAGNPIADALDAYIERYSWDKSLQKSPTHNLGREELYPIELVVLEQEGILDASLNSVG